MTTSRDEAEQARVEGGVFVSYARGDQAFVRRLATELSEHGHPVWVDWQGIRPTADWMSEVRAAIDAAPALVFVVSEASAASAVCREEADHAIAADKRILPVALQPVDPGLLPPEVARRNWIPGDDVERAGEQLARALETDPEWAATHTRMLVRATEWSDAGRDSSLLLRGQELTRAEAWLGSVGERSELRPTPPQTEFILAGRTHAVRRQRLRTAVLGTGLAVALALAAYALVQRSQAEDRAREARSRELAATALSQRSANPELSLLLAVEAAEEDGTAAAERAVRETVVDTYARRVLSGHSGDVNSAALSEDGAIAATASTDGTAIVWDSRSGRPRRRLELDAGAVNDVALDSSGAELLTATGKGQVALWDARSGRAMQRYRRRGPSALSAALRSDGEQVAAGFPAGVEVWSRGGRPVRSLRGLGGRTVSVSYGPGGRTLLTAGADGRLRVWSSSNWERLLTIDVSRAAGRPTGEISAADQSGNGKAVLTASDDGAVRVWGARDGELWAVLPVSRDFLYGAEFAPDGRRIAAGGLDGQVTVWDPGPLRPPSGGEPRRGTLLNTLRAPAGGVLGVDAIGGGRVISAHSDDVARIWSMGRLDFERALPHPAQVYGVAANADRTEFLTSGEDGVIRIWPADGSGRPQSLRHPGVISAAFSPDGGEIASAGLDGRARLRDRAGGSARPVRGTHGPLYAVAFSPDGGRLGIGGQDGGWLWSAEGERPARPLRPAAGVVFGVAFSADGETVATAGGDGRVKLWSADDGELTRALAGHTDIVNAVAFSPDGSLVASGSEDRTVRIWSAGTGETLRILRGHLGAVWGVAFSPDGSEIATGGVDGTVRVWDTASGQLLDVLRGPADWVRGVAYGAGEDRIIAASSDGKAYLLRCGVCLPFEDVLEIAKRRIEETLTAEERRQYLREAGIELQR